jgi:hypothetical protein
MKPTKNLNNMTAVEFLAKQLIPKALTAEQYYHIEQALEMEKQQIIDAFQYKFFHPYVENEPEIYYNETYKNETK